MNHKRPHTLPRTSGCTPLGTLARETIAFHHQGSTASAQCVTADKLLPEPLAEALRAHAAGELLEELQKAARLSGSVSGEDGWRMHASGFLRFLLYTAPPRFAVLDAHGLSDVVSAPDSAAENAPVADRAPSPERGAAVLEHSLR